VQQYESHELRLRPLLDLIFENDETPGFSVLSGGGDFVLDKEPTFQVNMLPENCDKNACLHKVYEREDKYLTIDVDITKTVHCTHVKVMLPQPCCHAIVVFPAENLPLVSETVFLAVSGHFYFRTQNPLLFGRLRVRSFLYFVIDMFIEVQDKHIVTYCI
jgi:hypothetical protein